MRRRAIFFDAALATDNQQLKQMAVAQITNVLHSGDYALRYIDRPALNGDLDTLATMYAKVDANLISNYSFLEPNDAGKPTFEYAVDGGNIGVFNYVLDNTEGVSNLGESHPHLVEYVQTHGTDEMKTSMTEKGVELKSPQLDKKSKANEGFDAGR